MWTCCNAAPTSRWSAAASSISSCPAARLHYQLFDDRDYPFAVNPQFKPWLPLTRKPGSWLVYTPGKRPKVIYLQPLDYWHVVPDAPGGYWVEHFDIVVIREPEEAAAAPADGRRALRDPRRTAERWRSARLRAEQPAARCSTTCEYQRAYKTPYEIAMMREATRDRRARAPRRRAAFRAGASEFGIHMAYCQAARQDDNELPYSNIVALNEHGAVLHYTDFDRMPPQPRAQLPDRRRRQPRRLCLRHHPHLLGRSRRRVPGADRCGRRRAAGDVRAGARRLRLPAAAPGRAPRARRRSCSDFGVITRVAGSGGRNRRIVGVLPARHRPRHRPAGARRRGIRANPTAAARSPSPRAIPTCA